MSVIRRNPGFCASVLAWAFVLVMATDILAQDAIVEDLTDGPPAPVSRDYVTGFAIDGFDPVSYFTDAQPKNGEVGYELRWRGAAWRFANSGNRDAFRDHPQIYAPQFGGFAVVSLARGQLVDGDPQVFLVRDGKLYLFFSALQRAVFEQAPEVVIAKAQKNWREINKLPAPVQVEAAKPDVPDGPLVPIFD